METMVTPTIAEPPEPTMIEDPNNMGQDPPAMIENRREVIKWESQLKMMPKRELSLETALQQAYAIVWDQCSITMKSKIEQLANYEDINNNKDPVAMLTEIRNITCGREAHKEPVYSMVQLLKAFCLLKQEYHETNEKYKERFDGLFDSVIQQGGCMTHHPGLINARAEEIAFAANRPDGPEDDDIAAATAEVAEEIKASFLLSGANNSRHENLKNFLEDQYTNGVQNNYPRSTADVLQRLNNHRGVVPTQEHRNNGRYNRREEEQKDDDDDNLQFLQAGDNNNNESAETQEGVNMLMAGQSKSQPTYAEMAKAKSP